MVPLHTCRITFDKKYETKVERLTDDLLIKRGAGNFLFSFLKYHDRKYKRYKKKDRLTKDEVKNLLFKCNGSKFQAA